MKNDKRELERNILEQPENSKRKDDGGESREENLDKTIEDSFPASDPPSSIPDPEDKEDAA